MGGRSSSSSSTSNATSQTDRRIGAAEGSIVVAEQSNATLNVTTTDYGAVGQSMETVRAAVNAAVQGNAESTRRALEAGTAATRDALGFGETALEANAEVSGKAFDLAESAVGSALGFGTEALGMIQSNLDKSLSFANDAMRREDERNWQQSVKWVGVTALGYFAMKAFAR